MHFSISNPTFQGFLSLSIQKKRTNTFFVCNDQVDRNDDKIQFIINFNNLINLVFWTGSLFTKTVYSLDIIYYKFLILIFKPHFTCIHLTCIHLTCVLTCTLTCTLNKLRTFLNIWLRLHTWVDAKFYSTMISI